MFIHQVTSSLVNIPAIYIEKDYWVTFALHTIFHSEISKVVSAVLPEVEINEVTQKMGMNRKTAHTYAKEFQGNYGQVRDIIIVEASWLGYHEPNITKPVSSFIYRMMVENGQEDLAVQFGLLPFEVMALQPVRTLCEKIMSLVRFSYTDNPIEDLKKKIRHTYDLSKILQEKELSVFFDSSAFDELLLKVANDDVISFKNNNDWLIHHPNKAVIFADTDSVWRQLITTYNDAFKTMVFGSLPNESAILETLVRIKERLSAIEWTIKIEK